MPNREEVKGKCEEGVAAVKEKVGRVIDDKEMERQGAVERDAGDVRNYFATNARIATSFHFDNRWDGILI